MLSPGSTALHPSVPNPATAPANDTGSHLTVGTLRYTKRGLFLVFFWLLAGDVVFTLMDQIEPRVLPVILKHHGATDKEIALLVGSIAALLNLLVTPIVSFRSDRKRGPRGRRIPYLLWSTPFAVLFLVLTPFAPQLTTKLVAIPAVAGLLAHSPVSSPVVAVYGALVVFYQVFHMVVASIYFYLFRDVVPANYLGRFLALFRVFGAVATFVLNYWLMGIAISHTWQLFTGVAIAYGLGFWAMCVFVKEGDYPPVEEAAPTAGAGALASARTFVAESYTRPLYWWTYLARLSIYAMVAVQAFLIFFPQRELGLPLDQIGKLIAWASFVWLPLAYPLGLLIDRWGPARTLSSCLLVYLATLAASFFGITGERSFFVLSLLSGAVFPMLMLAQSVLAQHVFPASRMGQLSAANVIVQALAIGVIIIPATGWFFDAMQDFHAVLALPGIGEIAVGPYRFIYVILAALTLTSLLGTYMTRRYLARG